MVRFIGMFVAVVVFVGCGSRGHEPFVVEPEELANKLQRLALSPVAIPDGLQIPDTTVDRLHFILATRLDDAGFGVVGPNRVNGIWEPLVDEVGGYYDPKTGRIIEEKREAVNVRFTETLRERHNVDAIVYPELLIVDAPFSDGSARWDGTSQSVAGFWAKLAEALTAVGDAMTHTPHVSTLPVGTVQAVTLQIVIEDLEGNELYTNWGGIEVIADDKTGEWLDPDVTFQNVERFDNAVDIAVKEFVEKIGDERVRPEVSASKSK